ncbi:glycoside hydrolase family 16 protein [Paractinoplanes durhamensis]|uniref:glycoside hydrolase family 16 protein n=1 Tax=Paractinoplanes durhamensis TaxID=113563 RepID=UPI00362C4FC7
MLKRLAAIGVGLALVCATAACRGTEAGDGPDASPSSEWIAGSVSPGQSKPGTKASGPATSVSPKPGTEVNWGDPAVVENFNGPLNSRWGVYDSPDSKPPRSSDMVSVSGGMLHLSGGVSQKAGKDVGAGLGYFREQMFGKWEVRFRVQAGAGYAPAVLLWPEDNADWPAHGEIDMMEVIDPKRQGGGTYLHHGKDNAHVGVDYKKADFTKFHTVGVEWLPSRVTFFLDGQPYFNVTADMIDTGLPDEGRCTWRSSSTRVAATRSRAATRRPRRRS